MKTSVAISILVGLSVIILILIRRSSGKPAETNPASTLPLSGYFTAGREPFPRNSSLSFLPGKDGRVLVTYMGVDGIKDYVIREHCPGTWVDADHPSRILVTLLLPDQLTWYGSNSGGVTYSRVPTRPQPLLGGQWGGDHGNITILDDLANQSYWISDGRNPPAVRSPANPDGTLRWVGATRARLVNINQIDVYDRQTGQVAASFKRQCSAGEEVNSGVRVRFLSSRDLSGVWNYAGIITAIIDLGTGINLEEAQGQLAFWEKQSDGKTYTLRNKTLTVIDDNSLRASDGTIVTRHSCR